MTPCQLSTLGCTCYVMISPPCSEFDTPSKSLVTSKLGDPSRTPVRGKPVSVWTLLTKWPCLLPSYAGGLLWSWNPNPHVWVTKGVSVGQLGSGFVELRQHRLPWLPPPQPHVITCGSSGNPKFALFADIFFNIPSWSTLPP